MAVPSLGPPRTPTPTRPVKVPPGGAAGDTGFTYNPNARFQAALKGANRDAFVALNSLFSGYGLASLAPKIFSFIQNGYSADTITLLLQQTPEYKQRFIGNEARTRAGLSVLSPADYIHTEDAYKQVMISAGLPSGRSEEHTSELQS